MRDLTLKECSLVFGGEGCRGGSSSGGPSDGRGGDRMGGEGGHGSNSGGDYHDRVCREGIGGPVVSIGAVTITHYLNQDGTTTFEARDNSKLVGFYKDERTMIERILGSIGADGHIESREHDHHN